MAIESLYWKEELVRIAKTIRPISKPRRWSERGACTVERDVMIGCFIVRRLIELLKVSSRISKMQLEVKSVPAIKEVDKWSRFSIDENYDWASVKSEKKAVTYVCNQCIHAYISYLERGSDRNWLNLLVVSDFDRKNVIWQIPFSSLIGLFEAAAKDWPLTYHMEYDENRKDYVITTD